MHKELHQLEKEGGECEVDECEFVEYFETRRDLETKACEREEDENGIIMAAARK